MQTVDVILPFHRDDLFLRIAINSVLGSREVNVRLILIDDRPHPTPIFDLDPHISLQTGGVGYAKALNSALPLLNSDYVALMNSDDWSSPDRFIKQIGAIERSGKDFAICALKKFKGSRIAPALMGEQQGDVYDPRVLLLGAYGANATWLSTRRAWIENVKFDESDISDWLSSFKILPKVSPVFVNEYLYWYRQHDKQTTNSESQRKNSFRDLLVQASNLANELNLFDEHFEMNFRITAAPYSLSGLPERWELLSAWTYLKSIRELQIPGAENLLIRRRFLLAFKLVQRLYLRLDIFAALLVGFIELMSSVVGERLTLIPEGLRSSNQESVKS